MTDEAGVARGSTVDGLGRLVAVTEDPAGLNYTTRYAYDANDALLTVCPHGGALSGSTCSGSDRQRQFSYDRLARLKTVQNPEAAVIEYFYDEAASTQGKGNLTRKVQQRGLSGAVVSGEVRYHYDEWNRPVSRVYSGLVNGVTTPNVTYRYDTHEYPVSGVTSYPKGRLTGVKSGGVEVALDSMDAQGRVTRSRQVTDGVSYRFGTDTLAGYEYFRQGGLARMRYPSGREVTYTVDDLGRAVTAAGLLSGQVRNYVQSVQYTAFGAVAEMRLNGTSLRERFGYSPQRLQMVGVDVERCANVACGTPEELLHLEYIYGSNNNGNPREQVIRSAGMNVRQRYDYDGLNRLRQFRKEPVAGGSAVLTEDYCYDRHGNRAVLARPGLSAQTPQVTTCTEAPVLGLFPGNRIAGTSYDAGGELGSDGWNGLRFDLEGRLRKSIPGSGAETSYEYDGEGRRVVKQTGVSRTVFVYDAAGQLAAEYGSTVSESRTEFVHGDMLGSTRLVTDGTVAGRRFDYWPFGAELTAGDTPYRTVGFTGAGPAQRFTGKERDGETGLDYFLARYYSGAQGRFTSPDWSEAPQPVPYADFSDPQTLNLYGYARNNPLTLTDPDGHCPSCATGLLGAAGGAAAYYVTQKITNQPVTFKGVVAATLGGAVTGFTLGLATAPATTAALFTSTTVETGLAVKLGVATGASITGGIVTRGIESGGDLEKTIGTPEQIATDATIGLAGEGLSALMAPAVKAGTTAGRAVTVGEGKIARGSKASPSLPERQVQLKNQQQAAGAAGSAATDTAARSRQAASQKRREEEERNRTPGQN